MPVAAKIRRGTTSIEFAITCPIVFFLVFAIIVGGMGVFRYQEVAAMAREGARWACVHGGEYAEDTGQPVARIFEDSLHDRWYTAQQALDYGFVDGIVSDFAQVVPRRRRRAGLGVGAEEVAA